MRDIHIQAIDRKIQRIRTYRLIGQIIAVTLLIVSLILIFSTLNTLLMMSTDTLNKLNDVSMELDELSIDPAEENRSTGQIEALTPTERALIERIVMSESGGESLEAQMAVAQTIYDRMNDWGDPLQVAIKTYSTTDNGAPTDSVKLAVSNVFDKGARIYEGGTYQFHDDSVLPYWTEGKVNRGSIGRLSFYGGYAE